MSKTTAAIESVRNSPDHAGLPGEFPAYAWPGGYPIIYLTEDGSVLCPDCVNGKNDSEVGNPEVDGDPQWTVVAHDCYWEGPPMQCDHCNGEIESAYGDPDAMKIKLDNLDRDDDSVLVTCEDKEAARDDQSIEGSHWECPRDMEGAYAVISDRPGLVEALEKEGYDVDASNYCPPDE